MKKKGISTKIIIFIIIIAILVAGAGLYFLKFENKRTGIEFNNLEVNPNEVKYGENVRISVEAKNLENQSKTTEVKLFINGAEETAKQVPFDPKEKTTVAFEINKKISRKYNARIKNLEKDFEVLPPKDFINPVKTLKKSQIREKIRQGKEFLFKADHNEKNGFYKRYDALNDNFENHLVTVYSASIVYTLMLANNLNEDPKIINMLPKWGDFLLSMQNDKEGSKGYGAFYYSYNLNEEKKRKRFVIGTSSLSIFTLLKLYNYTEEEKYLDSAKLAGNWLLEMQNSNGTMDPYLRFRESDGKWVRGKKESLLYEGQTLSALSRLYRETKKDKYLESAEKIADRFVTKYENENGYIEGGYRDKNSISNAWVVMSLLDYHKALENEKYKNVFLELSQLIIEKQITKEENLLRYGRWSGLVSSSGNGWIAEIMTEMYKYCLQENIPNREKYKDAAVKSIRWLVQNTYSENNTFFLQNPDRAIGAVIRNYPYPSFKNTYDIRTDAVCHAMNSYIIIFPYLKEGTLLSTKNNPK